MIRAWAVWLEAWACVVLLLCIGVCIQERGLRGLWSQRAPFVWLFLALIAAGCVGLIALGVLSHGDFPWQDTFGISFSR
jgi:hypothetical protein